MTEKRVKSAVALALVSGINAGLTILAYPNPFAGLFVGICVFTGISAIIVATNPDPV